MQHACGVMRLSPQTFWSMTPRELALTLPKRREQRMPRTVLTDLMQTFPDRDNSDG